MDLVAFIYVNDHWGHVHGDEVLRSVAGIISRAAGERPVWRCGGDEFLVMSTGGAAPALALATAIRDAIRDLGEASPGRPMDVRIGIAVAGAFDTAETLYRRADAAMVIADGRDARIALS
jgi:diguanylate cyclase (GGDEF)-like protein